MKSEIKLLQKQISLLCEEWADDDTFIENLCLLNGLSEEEVYGNTYYVPGVQEKVEMLVKKLGGRINE